VLEVTPSSECLIALTSLTDPVLIQESNMDTKCSSSHDKDPNMFPNYPEYPRLGQQRMDSVGAVVEGDTVGCKLAVGIELESVG